MKRVGNLYEKVIDKNNIKMALYKAYNSKKPKVRKKYDIYIENANYYVDKLYNNLHISGLYMQKTKIDNNSGKTRVLEIPKFYPDQIIQHALTNITLPYLMKKITYECCCSIKGRGTLYASKLLRKYIRNKNVKYYVQFDIIKYFPSIDRNILIELLSTFFKDKKIIDLYKEIIFSVPSGLPIGNYTSQSLSNIYLTPLDRYIKQILKIKYYVRYADDFVILGTNKRKLIKVVPLIINFLKNKLKLSIHNNIKIYNIYEKPIDFSGFKHYKNRTTIRKRNWKKARRMLIRKITTKRARRLVSYNGYIRHSNSRYILMRFREQINNSKKILRKDKKKNGTIHKSNNRK